MFFVLVLFFSSLFYNCLVILFLFAVLVYYWTDNYLSITGFDHCRRSHCDLQMIISTFFQGYWWVFVSLKIILHPFMLLCSNKRDFSPSYCMSKWNAFFPQTLIGMSLNLKELSRFIKNCNTRQQKLCNILHTRFLSNKKSSRFFYFLCRLFLICFYFDDNVNYNVIEMTYTVRPNFKS